MFKSFMIELGGGKVQGKDCSVLRLKDKRFVIQDGYLVLMQGRKGVVNIYLSNARHGPFGKFIYGSEKPYYLEDAEIVSQQFLVDNFLQAMTDYVAAKAIAKLTSTGDTQDGGDSAA